MNWYIGGKKVKRGDKEAKPEVIIYANPISDLERRVSSLEDNVDKIMEDGDNDGVSDYFDKDPETPEGYVVDGSGVSQDTDKDGIPDELDEDPYSSKGAQVDANGNEYIIDAEIGEIDYSNSDIIYLTDVKAVINLDNKKQIIQTNVAIELFGYKIDFSIETFLSNINNLQESIDNNIILFLIKKLKEDNNQIYDNMPNNIKKLLLPYLL